MNKNRYNNPIFQLIFILFLCGSGATSGFIGIYALTHAPTLFVDANIITFRDGIEITAIDSIALETSDLWKVPAFTDTFSEKNWWRIQHNLHETLKQKATAIIRFTSDNSKTSWIVTANIGRMSLREAFLRVGLTYLVGIIFILSAIYVLLRHSNNIGFLCAFFLGSTALYLISIAPVLHRALIMDDFYMRLLINIFFISSTAQLSILHFSALFPRKKKLLENIPWLPYLLYGYAIIISLLYLTQIIALASALPTLFIWILLLLVNFTHSIIQEKDLFMRQQMRMSLLAPLLVAFFFTTSIVYPWTVGGALVDHFALFSLMLPFALILSLDNQHLFQLGLRTERTMKKEREQIHRELHDSVLNDLASIMIVTEGAQAFLERDKNKVKHRLTEIREIAVETSRQLRSLLWVVDDKQNLWTDILSLLRKISDDLLDPINISFEFNVEWNGHQTRQVSPTIKHAIHKLYREALINIIKHAQAQHVTANFKFTNEIVIIKIKDDGRGFDPSKTNKESYGIENMQRRINEIKGTFQIETQIGTGSCYIMHLPLSA